MSYDKDVYFVNLPDDQLAAACMDRVEDYFQYLNTSGLGELWKTSYRAYYNSELTGAKIYKTGLQNEYSNLNVNHYRSVLTTLIGMISQQKIAFDSKATNSDVKSQAQAILSNGLLEYYSEEKNLEDHSGESLESAVVMSEGWIFSGWNVQGGKIYGYHPETGAAIYEGDLIYKTYLPIQVARDVTKIKTSDNKWFITIDFENKWDLMVQFPEMAEKIRDAGNDGPECNRYRLNGATYLNGWGDDVPTFTLYHERTPSVPNGKLIRFINDEILLDNQALPYRNITLR